MILRLTTEHLSKSFLVDTTGILIKPCMTEGKEHVNVFSNRQQITVKESINDIEKQIIQGGVK